MHTTQSAAPPPQIVSKGEFAALLGVTPGRVSQYISGGKLDGDALVGEGRSARIRVDVAREQLRRRLDIGQRLGNGIGTRLDAPAEAGIPASPPTTQHTVGEPAAVGADAPPTAAPAPTSLAPAAPAVGIPTAPTAPAIGIPITGASASPTGAPPSGADRLDDLIRKAKLEQIERANRKEAEDEAARAGRYVLADATRAEMTRLAREMLTVFDGAVADLAAALAARFGLPQRDVVHLMRTEMRPVRARAAEAAVKRAGVQPEVIEDETGQQTNSSTTDSRHTDCGDAAGSTGR